MRIQPLLNRRFVLRRLTLLAAFLAALSFVLVAPSSSANAASATPIKASSSGKCLDVQGRNSDPGASLILWNCNNQDNQDWLLTSSGELRVYGTKLCLDVEGGRTTAPAELQTYACNGGNNQKWSISNGAIRGVQSGLCLDVTNGRTDNGAPVALWNCDGHSNQQWSTSSASVSAATVASSGWVQDFREDFNGSLDTNRWERYGYGYQPVGSGAMGTYELNNSYSRDGSLILRTQYRDGRWTSAGVSSRTSFDASMGQWEVRARFPQGDGLGYCFLLWPADGSWPPELNFAEGQAGNPVVSGTYHWGSDNKFEQVQTSLDLRQWHTYGVIMEPGKITFTVDGSVWGTLNNDQVTTKKMWVGLQSGAMDPNGSSAWWAQTVAGGVPNSKTPSTMEIEVDSVTHWRRG